MYANNVAVYSQNDKDDDKNLSEQLKLVLSPTAKNASDKLAYSLVASVLLLKSNQTQQKCTIENILKSQLPQNKDKLQNF